MRAGIVLGVLALAVVAMAAPAREAAPVGLGAGVTVARGELSVHGVFSHARHAARGGATCAACHTATPDPATRIAAAPTVETCATARCHDGKAAFGVTTACTRCHRDPGPEVDFKVARPIARYLHTRTHATIDLPCAACHPLTGSGEVVTVGHAPCATCHAGDFGLRAPKTCGACHNGTEPWRALIADRGPPERTEFGAELDHAKHAMACTRCHALTTPTSQLRPVRGHRACTGAGCHAVKAGPAPQLTACEGCHRAGLAHDRQAARLAVPWSVRATFDHASHARAAATGDACDGCHVDLHGATLLGLPAPPKSVCAPCHDGKTAFKLTGTGCKRCHPGAATGSATGSVK